VFNGENIITPRAGDWWTIGRLIAETVQLADFYPYVSSLTMHRYKDLDELQRAALSIANFYIHCAPCACLIQTAFSVCKDIASTLLRVTIRPDDRLRADCCSQENRAEGISLLVKGIKQQEANTKNYRMDGQIKYFDRWWMERRLQELDTEPTSSLSTAEQVFFEYLGAKKCAGIIILGELDDCLPLMQVRPFPIMARIPRETEIYQMKKMEWPFDDDEDEFERIFLGTYTPKNFKPGRELAASPVVQAAPLRPSVPGAAAVVHSRTVQTISPPDSPNAKHQKRSSSVASRSGTAERKEQVA
jgi:hypothetical protein